MYGKIIFATLLVALCSASTFQVRPKFMPALKGLTCYVEKDLISKLTFGDSVLEGDLMDKKTYELAIINELFCGPNAARVANFQDWALKMEFNITVFSQNMVKTNNHGSVKKYNITTPERLAYFAANEVTKELASKIATQNGTVGFESLEFAVLVDMVKTQYFGDKTVLSAMVSTKYLMDTAIFAGMICKECGDDGYDFMRTPEALAKTLVHVEMYARQVSDDLGDYIVKAIYKLTVCGYDFAKILATSITYPCEMPVHLVAYENGYVGVEYIKRADREVNIFGSIYLECSAEALKEFRLTPK